MIIPSSSGIAKARAHHSAYTDASAARTSKASPRTSTAAREAGSVMSDASTVEPLGSVACIESAATTAGCIGVDLCSNTGSRLSGRTKLLWPAPHQGVGHNEEHRGANDGNDQAIHIQPSDARHAEHIEQPAAHDGPNDAQNDIQQHPVARFVHELARNESSNQSQHDPRYK